MDNKNTEIDDSELGIVNGGVAVVGSGEYYTVKSIDTLQTIAIRFGTTSQLLCELNNITDPSYIYTGMKILIR